MKDRFIIKCSVKGQKNWSGKEFSDCAAKIYASFEEACQALGYYWVNPILPSVKNDDRVIRIISLSEEKKKKLLANGSIRW